jgi:hypothetical protein
MIAPEPVAHDVDRAEVIIRGQIPADDRLAVVRWHNLDPVLRASNQGRFAG